MQEDELFRTRALRVGYQAAESIAISDFAVKRGDYLIISGTNGSGKTTLVKTIAGLLEPISGEIIKVDEDLRIGYLPQGNLERIDFPASCYEVVLSGAQRSRSWRPFYTFKEKKLAERMMERMNVLFLRNKSFSELSGGQRQRILLARALVSRERILILDEPTTGLDTETTVELERILDELNSKGITIIIVTHEQRLIEKAHQRLIVG